MSFLARIQRPYSAAATAVSAGWAAAAAAVLALWERSTGDIAERRNFDEVLCV